MTKRRYRNQVNRTAGNVASDLLGPNPLRVGLIVSSHDTNDVFISFGQDAAANVGILIPANTQALVLAPCLLGDAIDERVSAIAPAGDSAISAIEILEDPFPTS